MTRRAKALLAINTLFFAGLLGFSAWTAIGIDWIAVGRSIEGASLEYELLMAASWFAILLVRPLRLMVLIGAMSPESPRHYGSVWSATLVAMGLNTIVPLRAGDIAMAFILRQNLGIRVPRAFSALIVDRFFDLATVMALFVGALSVAPIAATWTVGLVPAVLFALLCLAVGLWLVVHFRTIWLRLIHLALSSLAPARRTRWAGQADELFDGLARIEKTAVLVKVIALSIFIWLITTLSYWFGILATWPSASLEAAAFTASAAALVFVVPLTPTGVGVFHGACVLALSVFGIPFEPALAFAVVAHALQVSSVLVLAIAASFAQRLNLRTLLTSAETPFMKDAGDLGPDGEASRGVVHRKV